MNHLVHPKLKILHLCENYLPSISGVSEVIKQYSEGLVALGHQVTVVTSRMNGLPLEEVINKVLVKRFDIKGCETYGIFGNLQEFSEFLIMNDFDIVMAYATQQWSADLFFRNIKKIKGAKVLIPCGFSALFLESHREYFEYLKKVIPLCDSLVFHADRYRDVGFCESIFPRKLIHKVTNGASITEFSEAELIAGNNRRFRKKPFTILTVGNHTGGKGHKEAIKIFKRLGIENVELVIVGDETEDGCWDDCMREQKKSRWSIPFLFSRKRIRMLNLTRAETVKQFCSADLFLFCSNVECSPLVLFEACAAGLPFLSTDVGNANEIASWTKGGIILDTLKDSGGESHVNIESAVSEIQRLYFDRESLKKLSINGRQAFLNDFTWDKSVSKLEQIYLKLVKEKQNATMKVVQL